MPEFSPSHTPMIEPTPSEFVVGYLTCAEWTLPEPQDDDSEGPTTAEATGWAPKAVAAAIADCEAFQAQAADLLTLAYDRDYSEARAGHDFWLTRNHHGAGFWDRAELEDDSPDYERLTSVMVAASASGDQAAWDRACGERDAISEKSLGARLTTLANSFAEVDAYVGDDCKLYFM